MIGRKALSVLRWGGGAAAGILLIATLASSQSRPIAVEHFVAAPPTGTPASASTTDATPETLQRVLDEARAGDTIRLAPGDYPPIGLSGHDWAQQVVVEAGTARLKSVALKNVAGLTWRGGSFDGQDTVRVAFRMDQSRRVAVENADFGHYVRVGILVNVSTDARLTGNNFHDMQSDGIDIALSQRIFVDGTRCHDFRPAPGSHADCIQLWSRPTAPPTADVTVINTVATGEMQGDTAFNHVRNGVDDGGFDRIIFAQNDIRITFLQAVSLYDCRDCISRDNRVDTWPQAHNPARIIAYGKGSVLECNNRVLNAPGLPGERKCKTPLQLPIATPPR